MNVSPNTNAFRTPEVFISSFDYWYTFFESFIRLMEGLYGMPDQGPEVADWVSHVPEESWSEQSVEYSAKDRQPRSPLFEEPHNILYLLLEGCRSYYVSKFIILTSNSGDWYQ